MAQVFSMWKPHRWLAELQNVWADTRSIVIIAQIAAIYAAILIPFKAGVPIIPGFVELRPANAIPIVASLLFGPPAAWGAAIGNVIGDCFGTLGPASFFGFWGNFFFGYVPYRLWGRMGWLSSGTSPVVGSFRQGLEYALICVVASATCAGIIGLGVEWLGLLPFAVLAPAIFLNNIVMGIFLGPPLLKFLYPRVKRWGLGFVEIQSVAHERMPGGSGGLNPSLSVPAGHPDGGERESHLPLVECSGLSFQYAGGSVPVLKDVTFSIYPGEVVLLMGRSGTGKSTVSYACNGIVPHLVPGRLSGVVRIAGRPTVNDPVWLQAGRVGMVFQDFDAQLVATTVEGEIRHPLEYRPLSQVGVDLLGSIQRVLRRVGLEVSLDRDPITLSGGQRQRLVLASVLAQSPSVLVLDEPGSDLDPQGSSRLRDVVLALREEGMAVLWTAQHHDEMAYADRIVVLDDGRMAWTGKPEELLRQPRMMRDLGLRPLPLTECFEGIGVDPLPISVEEAWVRADRMQVVLDPPPSVMNDEVRLGKPYSPTSEQGPPIIQMAQVCFDYENHPVFGNLCLDVGSGEFLAVVGANGSGKSTLSRLLNGLLLPMAGRVLIDGLNTRETPINTLATHVGLVFQNPDHQIFAETVWEEVAFSARNIGIGESEIDDRVRDALAAVGMSYEQYRDLDPFSLRKGERQRIAVASVLATRPGVLIFDEPTTGLDVVETRRMLEMIRRLNQAGHTVVMITHSMRLVAEYATRCVLMNAGCIVGDGHPREVFSNPSLLASAALDVPDVSRFSQRWGVTLLSIDEVRASFSPNGMCPESK